MAPLAYSLRYNILDTGEADVPKPALRATVILVAAALLLTGCGGSSPAPASTPTATQSPQAFDLVILHTNDVRGFTEPCG